MKIKCWYAWIRYCLNRTSWKMFLHKAVACFFFFFPLLESMRFSLQVAHVVISHICSTSVCANHKHDPRHISQPESGCQIKPVCRRTEDAYWNSVSVRDGPCRQWHCSSEGMLIKQDAKKITLSHSCGQNPGRDNSWWLNWFPKALGFFVFVRINCLIDTKLLEINLKG